MKSSWIRSTTALAGGLALFAMVGTVTAPPAAAQMGGAAPAAEPAVEPAATAALDQMGAYLRTLKAFQVEAATSREEVLENGLKAQFANVTTILARMPDRLFAEASGDRQSRQYYYNGKEFTLYARRLTYYATVPAPATVKELAATARLLRHGRRARDGQGHVRGGGREVRHRDPARRSLPLGSRRRREHRYHRGGRPRS